MSLEITIYPWGEGNCTPLQYCCLENPMDGGAWWAAVHGVAKSQTRLKWLGSSIYPWNDHHSLCHKHICQTLQIFSHPPYLFLPSLLLFVFYWFVSSIRTIALFIRSAKVIPHGSWKVRDFFCHLLGLAHSSSSRKTVNPLKCEVLHYMSWIHT